MTRFIMARVGAAPKPCRGQHFGGPLPHHHPWEGLARLAPVAQKSQVRVPLGQAMFLGNRCVRPLAPSTAGAMAVPTPEGEVRKGVRLPRRSTRRSHTRPPPRQHTWKRGPRSWPPCPRPTQLRFRSNRSFAAKLPSTCLYTKFWTIVGSTDVMIAIFSV